MTESSRARGTPERRSGVALGSTPAGKVVGVNLDDDNGNGTNDWMESGVNTNEDDLVQIRVFLGPTNLPVGKVELEIVEGTNRINVWKQPYKGLTNLLLGAFSYTNLWVEGLTNSLKDAVSYGPDTQMGKDAKQELDRLEQESATGK